MEQSDIKMTGGVAVSKASTSLCPNIPLVSKQGKVWRKIILSLRSISGFYLPVISWTEFCNFLFKVLAKNSNSRTFLKLRNTTSLFRTFIDMMVITKIIIDVLVWINFIRNRSKTSDVIRFFSDRLRNKLMIARRVWKNKRIINSWRCRKEGHYKFKVKNLCKESEIRKLKS